LVTTSAIEVAAGLGLVLAPALVTGLLLGEELVAPASVVVARVAGIALIAIGATCWLARASAGMGGRTDVIAGLFIYNTAVPVVLVHAAMVLGMRGVGLWPAVILHTVLAFWCIGCLRSRRSSSKHHGVVRWVLLLGAATAPGTLTAQLLQPRDIDSLPSRPADHRIAYGADSLQFADLRLPEGAGPFPVAIVIHGGCWVSHFATLRSTAALADALRDSGIATWNVEYRRLDHPGGGWPGTFLDVAAAADYLPELARRFPLDLERVVAVGHSAGGHLALWLGGRSRLPPSSALYRPNPLRLTGAVSLGGPGDLADFTTYARSICGRPVIEELMGGPPAAVPERYAQGSPRELLPLGTPQSLIVGEHDPVVPAAARDRYVAAALAGGERVEAVSVPEAGHFEVIAPTSPAWATVRDRILSAFGRQRR
jgi:acetyl esterase/lipase